MTKNYFEEMMAELGFHTTDNIAVGMVEGRPCSVEFDKDAEETTFYLRMVVAGNVKPVAKTLKEQGIEHLRWFAEKDEEDEENSVLVGVLTLASDFYAKGSIHGAVAAAEGALRAAGLQTPDACPLCGSPGCDRYAYLAEGCRPVHEICLQNRLDLPETDTKTPLKVKGYYLTGVIGALLGAAIAALPNWSQALSKGTINSFIYAFIPFLSALLYRLFRGKAKLAASGIIVMASSLVMAFVLELVWYWLILTSQAGYNMSIFATTTLYFETHTFALTVREMLFSLLFVVVGFFPSAVLLRRYAEKGTTGGRKLRGSRFVRESAFAFTEGEVKPDIPRETDEDGVPAADEPPPKPPGQAEPAAAVEPAAGAAEPDKETGAGK